jgi:hypothetical protein
MTRNCYPAIALTVLILSQANTVAADQAKPVKAPPIVPAMDELPVRGVPLFNIHQELDQCVKDATALLGGKSAGPVHVQIGMPQTFFSQDLGYILRADFTRDDVRPPLINRIVCWHSGELIVSRISAPALSPDEPQKAIAVPSANPLQN